MIKSIDHFVLTVASIEETVSFYQHLGMELVRFGEGRIGLHFGQQKINLHEAGHEFEPKARRPTPGSADFCLIASEPLEVVVTRLSQAGITVELGPVARTGAMGPIRSLYVRDPDGNLVEIAVPMSA